MPKGRVWVSWRWLAFATGLPQPLLFASCKYVFYRSASKLP